MGVVQFYCVLVVKGEYLRSSKSLELVLPLLEEEPLSSSSSLAAAAGDCLRLDDAGRLEGVVAGGEGL